jgi:hypothetical protein
MTKTKWIQALLVAAAVEVPLIASLAILDKEPFDQSFKFLGNFPVWYHILSIPIGMSAANIWSSKSTPEAPIHGTDAVFLLAIYASQVLITTPLIYLLARVIGRLREGRALNRKLPD